MISYHGNSDLICAEAIKRGYIKVDAGAGKAWAVRFYGKELSSINRLGYKVFTLHLDGKRLQIKFHRLIWIAANGLIPEGMMIDHINRDRSDNRLENLNLVDAKGNAQNRRNYSGRKNPAAKFSEEVILKIRADFKSCKNVARIARKYGVSHSQTSNIVHRRSWV